MSDDLRILFIEDSPEDAEMEERELRRAGLKILSRRVETRESILQALDEFNPTLIISDYSLPRLNGLDALKIVREVRSDIPFIFVSGTIGEERAIESLKSGATDYVVKHRLGGLVSKVQRALAETQERKRRQMLEEQVRQAQKMEAIGRLAGGVAHDFNNLLTVINGYSELMIARLEGSSTLKPELEEVLAAGRRAASLTRQLLAFSRRQVVQPTLIDLNAIAANLQKMLSRLVGEDVTVALELDRGLHPVMADSGQMEQVLMNLVVNARDAMAQGGRITIRSENVELPRGDPRRPSGSAISSHVRIAVQDTGTGITPEVRSRLFEPFFTTKGEGKGTGLGLSTVHGIVIQAGGSIQVESEIGRGSTFSVYLPKSALDTTSPEKPSAAEPRKGSGTILIAEDQESVRRLVSTILEASGYRVFAASSGSEALKISEDHPQPIDLLITDMVMRSMNGDELAKLLRRIHPETRVLYMSGYSDRNVQEAGLLDRESAFLHKPFTMDDLKQKVQALLEPR